MKYIAIIIALLSANVAGQEPVDDTASVIAWKNGWMAYSIDAYSIELYHRLADDLVDDRDMDALELVWWHVIEQAKEQERQWEALSKAEKYDYQISPFWKGGNGLPRRFSIGGKQ